ncbi:MAG: hypothetical protein U0930_15675 [Pirellulales bacterium]
MANPRAPTWPTPSREAIYWGSYAKKERSAMLTRLQKKLAVLGILTALHTPAYAQSTALKRMFQSKDSAEPLKLQDKHGPWLILAQTFPGDEGKDQAVIYAKEIASQFRVPTFIWERNNETEEVLGRGERERTTMQGGKQKNLLEVKYANAGPNKSFAVLVGEFQSKEDPQIAKLKEQIKKYEPKAKLPQQCSCANAYAKPIASR